jgi:hypothetical protein
MKKNILIVAIIATAITIAGGLVFNACRKNVEDAHNIEIEFKKILNDTKPNRNQDIAFYDNPFNFQGEKHNQLLQMFFDKIYPNVDPTQYANAFVKMASLNIDKPDAAAERILNLLKDIVSKDGYYNPKFINSLSGITQTEKNIVNAYFEKMQQISDLNSRIALSKQAEDFIIKEKELSSQEKANILSTFAIYRYSTYFWNSKERQTKYLSNCDIADAIGFFIATQTDLLEGTRWEAQDGKDAYAYAGFVSNTVSFAGGCF